MIYLINPHLVCHKDDSHSSGIPYQPAVLAYLTAVLEKKGFVCRVIDVFGMAPFNSFMNGSYLLFGWPLDKIKEAVKNDCEAIIFYANAAFNYESLNSLIKLLDFDVPKIVVENTNAVTGFSLSNVAESLGQAGVTHLVLGEPEASLPTILNDILNHRSIPEIFRKHVWTPGESTHGKVGMMVETLDDLPYPAWEHFPLENYWKLKVAHGPMKRKYLAIITSRGCPYPCEFCSVPVMNNQRWRKRSALSVVEEMEVFKKRLGVSDFHWEDPNPTIDERRIQSICQEIMRRQLKITWKIVSGTKLDNLSMDTLELMARSGLDFIGFAPESGSTDVLKKIRKPFKHDYALQQVRFLTKHKVRTQAVFVLGFPGENEEDRRKTMKYSTRLFWSGLSEVAYFIVTPMPGTPTSKAFDNAPQNLSNLTYTPTWRDDFQVLKEWRDRLYLNYFFWRVVSHPFSFFRSCFNAMIGSYELKMEMFTRRLIWVWLSRIKSRVTQRAVLLGRFS